MKKRRSQPGTRLSAATGLVATTAALVVKTAAVLVATTASTAIAATTASTTATAVTADQHRLETVVVTATRTPRALADTLVSATVLERAAIERLQASDIVELLTRVPAVSLVRNGGRGAATAMFIRGNQSDHSLFLVDGVRVGSATLGSPQLALLSTRLIERIEIIRGPRSALYGADAIGGVVNISTRTTQQPRELMLETSFGSHDSSEGTLLAGLNSEDYGITLGANVFDTAGVDNTESTTRLAADEDGWRNASLAVTGRINAVDKLSLRFSYNRSESKNEYDANCTSLTNAPLDCLIYSENTVAALSGLAEIELAENLDAVLRVGQTEDRLKNLATNVSLADTFNGGAFNTKKTEATWFNNLALNEQLLLTVGLDYQLDEVDGDSAYAEDSRANKAAFAQLQVTAAALSLNVGLRHDDNEQFGGRTTASAEAGWTVTDRLRLTAGYGEGFKAPTFNDLYFPGFGNPGFKPEQSKNRELGLRAGLGAASLTVAAWHNRIENLIQYNPATFTSDQTAAAEITGLEFTVSAALRGTDIALAGHVMEPQNKVNGKQLARRAQQQLSLDVDRAGRRFAAGATVLFTGDRYDDAANTIRLNAYARLDLRARYQINAQWLLRAKINNVLDKNYVMAYDFSLGKYAVPGREVFITIAYTSAL